MKFKAEDRYRYTEDSLEHREEIKFQLSKCGTMSYETGSGGRHYVFFGRYTGAMFCFGVVAPGIDVRGAGGYVVIPPSRHISGGTYGSVVLDGDNIEVLEDIDEFLFDAIVNPDTNRRLVETTEKVKRKRT